MDLFNSIKEWFSGLAGDAAGNLAEVPVVDELQQQVGETAQGLTDEAQGITDQVNQFKDNLPR
jgi:hypothetical protein